MPLTYAISSLYCSCQNKSYMVYSHGVFGYLSVNEGTNAVYQKPQRLSREFTEMSGYSILYVPHIPLHLGRNGSMSGRCEVCQRRPMYGNNVSHSQRRTRRRFVLNVQRRHMRIDGTMRTINICTRCLRTMSKLPKVR